MSIKGGYKVLNLEGFNFTNGVGTLVPGAYKLITSNEKAVLVSGLDFASKSHDDMFVNFVPNNDMYIGVVGTQVDGGQLTCETITIMSTDYVTISTETVGA